MTQANEQANQPDIERLELYLDRELSNDEAAAVEQRLTGDAALRGTLDQLRGQRMRRLAAMSFAFDTDSATVERLVASVRTAQMTEARERRRSSGGWLRPAMSAAACIAFGLGLGVVLHKQHGGASPDTGGRPAVTAGFGGSPVGLDSNVSLQPQGAYVVALRDLNGNIVAQVQFATRQEAEAFIGQVNSRNPNGSMSPTNVGNAKVVERPY